ncbi:MAG: hypothetical protein LAO06_16070 [Acidobacteriia bacterium]|nr:hypothetical protein [Terriglobia bacterium]
MIVGGGDGLFLAHVEQHGGPTRGRLAGEQERDVRALQDGENAVAGAIRFLGGEEFHV